MKIISVIFLIGLIVFLFITRNYKKDQFKKEEYFYSSACFLLEKCHLSMIFSNIQKQRICQLFIGEDWKEVTLKYQCKRISYGIYGIFIVLCLVLALSFFENTEDKKENRKIMRPDYGKGTKEVSQEVILSDPKTKENIRQILDFKVQEKQYTKKEWKEILKKVEKWLDYAILGENLSVDKIDTRLILVEKYPNTSIKIKWKTDGKYIKEDGTLRNTYNDETIPKTGVLTELTAVISCFNYKAEYSIYLKIFPKQYTKAESAWNQFISIILKQEEKTRRENFFEIPEKIENYLILFPQKKDDTKVLIAIVGIIFTMIFTMIPAEKIKEEEKQRKKQLDMDYPKIINKFVLLIGAGLTVRGVFEKLVWEYRRNRENGGEKRYLYEEMVVFVRAIENGTSEIEALERFGKRIQLLSYVRFCSLLLQNQKKGSEDLLFLLENEAMIAMEKNSERMRIIGEEAGTKLLLPMIIMLCIVFAIIMIPAFMSF